MAIQLLSVLSATITHMTSFELRSETSGQQVVQAFRQVADAAGNAGGAIARPTGEQLQNSYLSWTEDAVRALSNVIDRDAASDFIHTQHYWALRTASADTPRLVAQVMAELENRKRILGEIADSLDRERKRWLAHPAILVVPDTNLFLQEGKPFREIDWLDIVGRAGDVRLVIPIVVIHELDRLKRTGNNTTRSLARQALRWLVENLPADLKEQSEPLSSAIPTTRLEVYVHDGNSRPEDADGVIIRTARRLAQLSEMSTKLVTYDLGMKLRAATVGVATLQLSDA